MLTSRAGNAQAIGQRLQKKLPYGGRAERTRAFKKANLAMTVLFCLRDQWRFRYSDSGLR